jgi:hypothetical protein
LPSSVQAIVTGKEATGDAGSVALYTYVIDAPLVNVPVAGAEIVASGATVSTENVKVWGGFVELPAGSVAPTDTVYWPLAATLHPTWLVEHAVISPVGAMLQLGIRLAVGSSGSLMLRGDDPDTSLVGVGGGDVTATVGAVVSAVVQETDAVAGGATESVAVTAKT